MRHGKLWLRLETGERCDVGFLALVSEEGAAI